MKRLRIVTTVFATSLTALGLAASAFAAAPPAGTFDAAVDVVHEYETFLLERGFILASPDKAELYVMATFGWGLGFYGQSVYVAELHRLHGWPTSLISLGTTFFYLSGAALASVARDALVVCSANRPARSKAVAETRMRESMKGSDATYDALRLPNVVVVQRAAGKYTS